MKSRTTNSILADFESIPEQVADDFLDRHLAPTARTDIINFIYKNKNLTAMLDLSDGLLIDAARLARASQVSLHIDLEALPILASVTDWISPRIALLSGEEYELLFTLDQTYSAGDRLNDLDATCIGTTGEKQEQPVYYYEQGQPVAIQASAFEHFSAD